MRIIQWLLLLVILMIALIFYMKNSQPVELNYYVGVIEWPLSLIFLVTLSFGAILGVLSSLPIIFKLKRENMKLKSQVKQSEKEITNLRVLPLKDS